MTYLLRYFDGFSHQRRIVKADNYDKASHRARAFPPGYIWSLEPLTDKKGANNESA